MPAFPLALLVDDKPNILRALSRMLQRLDIDVVTAHSAEAALGFLAECAFHIVLTDHDMEGQNGLWLLEQANMLHPASRRVLMSGRRIAEFDAARERGIAHAFLQKPATREQLAEAIRPDARLVR